jgi:hypothetical protein
MVFWSAKQVKGLWKGRSKDLPFFKEKFTQGTSRAWSGWKEFNHPDKTGGEMVKGQEDPMEIR